MIKYSQTSIKEIRIMIWEKHSVIVVFLTAILKTINSNNKVQIVF